MDKVPSSFFSQTQQHKDVSTELSKHIVSSDKEFPTIRITLTTYITEEDEKEEVCLWSQSLVQRVEASTKDDREYIISKLQKMTIKELSMLSPLDFQRPNGKIIIHCIHHAKVSN
jgi:hypothetical protein